MWSLFLSCDETPRHSYHFFSFSDFQLILLHIILWYDKFILSQRMRRGKEIVMALEQVFECPRTLRRLRSGPLGKLLEGFCNWLLEHGFSRWMIRKHLSNLSHLNEHLGGLRREVLDSISSRDVEGFFKAYPLRFLRPETLEGHVRRVRYSINRLGAALLGRPKNCLKTVSYTFY